MHSLRSRLPQPPRCTHALTAVTTATTAEVHAPMHSLRSRLPRCAHALTKRHSLSRCSTFTPFAFLVHARTDDSQTCMKAAVQ